MKSLILGLVLAMSAVLPAAAENWVYLGSNEDDTSSQIDIDSVVQINGGYAYREMMINENKNKYLIVQKEMLCHERAQSIAGYVAYNRNGYQIGSHQNDSNFKKIAIGTITATLWEKLCN